MLIDKQLLGCRISAHRARYVHGEFQGLDWLRNVQYCLRL